MRIHSLFLILLLALAPVVAEADDRPASAVKVSYKSFIAQVQAHLYSLCQPEPPESGPMLLPVFSSDLCRPTYGLLFTGSRRLYLYHDGDFLAYYKVHASLDLNQVASLIENLFGIFVTVTGGEQP